MNSEGRSLGLAVVMSYATLAVGILSGLTLTPWILRTVGPENYGLYSLALSIVNFLAIDFGLYNVVSRYLSRYLQFEQKDLAGRFMSLIYLLYGALTAALVVGMVLLWSFSGTAFRALSATELATFSDLFVILALYTGLSFPLGWLGGVLIAGRRYVALRSIDFGTKLLNMALTIIAVAVIGSVHALVLSFVLASAVGVMAKLIVVLQSKIIQRPGVLPTGHLTREILRYCLSTAAVAIAVRLTIAISPALLAVWAGPQEVTIFSIAMMFEGYLWTLGHAMNSLFMPRLTALVTSSDRPSLLAEVYRAGRLQLVIVGLCVVGFALIGERFIHTWLGYSVFDVYATTILLIFPSLLTVPQEILNTWLGAVGRIGYRALSAGVSGAISISLAAVLIPGFGAIGAALSILLGVLVGNIVLANVIFSKILDVPVGKYFASVHARFVLPVILAVLVAFVFNGFVDLGSGWISLSVLVLVVGFSYCVPAWFLGLRGTDRFALRTQLLRM